MRAVISTPQRVLREPLPQSPDSILRRRHADHSRLHPQQPCGTGSSARLAIMHARGELSVDEPFVHASPIGSEFECTIRGTARVGEYDAVLPTVKGSGWITSFKQIVLDPTDPFPQGFRVGDAWHMPE